MADITETHLLTNFPTKQVKFVPSNLWYNFVQNILIPRFVYIESTHYIYLIAIFAGLLSIKKMREKLDTRWNR